MKNRTILGVLTVATAGLMAGAAMATGQVALNRLQTGRWNLNEIGVNDRGRDLCVATPDQLIQIYHPGLPCTRYVLDDSPDRVTIHYTCQARGYGRTTVSVENAQLIKVDTQGIDPDGRPFDKSFEGRRLGACLR